jgi:hypothetical protein
MPRTLQNPDSWLHTARVRTGYKTVRSLAERLGVALSQVVEWGRGPQRPMWQHIPKLAEAFGLGIPEVITGVWQESVGNPSPCGCGPLIPPDNPTARKLPIEIPCVNCGTTRTYTQGNCRFHFKLCRRCAAATRRGKRVELTCVGYNDFHTRRWAKKCPGKIQLLPYEIRRYQKEQHKPFRPFKPQRASINKSKKFKRQRAFINKSTKTFRCGSCARAAMILAVTKERVEAVMKSTDGTVPKISSRLRRSAMLSKYIREVNPEFIKAGGAAAPKNPNRSEAARRSLTISNIVNAWSKEELPRFYRMGTCLVCGKLTFDTKRPLKFHGPCWTAWLKSPDGRSFQRSLGMRRMEAELLPRRMGTPVDENKLKIRYSWAIQCRLGEKSYRQIAKEKNVADFTIVRDGIEFVIKKLPAPDLVAPRFQSPIQLLHDALKNSSPSIGVLNG